MKIKLTNSMIYEYANKLENYALNDNTYIPVVYNFYIQKNISTILGLKQEIEKCRISILKHYGKNDKNQFTIPSEHQEQVNNELQALSNIEQEVEIYKIPIQAFMDIKLTTGELKSIMFMIEEDPDFATHLANPKGTTSTTIKLME